MSETCQNSPSLPHTRTYQQEMLDASLRRNVVIAMGTGSGKTHVAVLRMKIEAEREQQKISWFLAPTVGLCEQQRDVIRTSIPVTVGLISGALEPNQWTRPKIWEDALSTHRIMVSTPQVLLDALRHGYINIGHDISLLVFDEAHHASDKHPYNLIMREFYDRCPPRTGAIDTTGVVIRPFILGLTASPMFGGDVDTSFRKIEQNLDSIILAPKNTRDDLEKHVYRPVFKHVLYPPTRADNSMAIHLSQNVVALLEVVKELDIQNDPFVHSLRVKLTRQVPGTPEYKRTDQRLSQAIDKKDTFVHGGMKSFFSTAVELCEDIGPWAADWYVQSVVEKAMAGSHGFQGLHELFADRHYKEKECLIDILKRIRYEPVSLSPAAANTGCSAKARKLIACLIKERMEWDELNEVFSGLIFVTRRDAVLALSELLSLHPHTKDTFMIGTLLGSSESSKRNSFLDITRTLLKQSQSETLADFRIGEKNLVISTAVAEEGIDIQACGSVIRWDLPQNMVSWAQSRGRARRQRSSFILMFEDGSAHNQQIRKWERLEKEMVQKYNDEQRHLRARAEEEKAEDDEHTESEDVQFVHPTSGAVISINSAISHLAHFCSVLPAANDYECQPSYDIFPPDYPEGFHALPPGRMDILPNPGPYSCTVTLPRFLPPYLRVYRTEKKYESKKDAQRRTAFNAYIAMHHAGLLNEHFLLLRDTIRPLQEKEVQALLKDVEKREGFANVHEQMNPWHAESEAEPLSDSQIWENELRIQGIGSIRMFTKSQVTPVEYSDSLFDPDFGKRDFALCPGHESSLTPRNLLDAKLYTRRLFSIFYGSRLKWDDLNFAYLFLPVNGTKEDVWDERRTWADTRSNNVNLNARDRLLSKATTFGLQYSYPDDIFMFADNRGRGTNFYRFIRWQTETLDPEKEQEVRRRSPRSEQEADLTYPLLVGRPLRNRMNFLVPLNSSASDQDETIVSSKYASIVLANANEIVLSLLLPSILRAVFLNMIASSLQKTLSVRAPELQHIPIEQIKTALMAPAANASFNYQRLETLGDTILKFITGIQLLAEHPTWPEGFLSRRKDRAVSNATLAKGAIMNELYRWIIRKMFVVKKWKPDYVRDDSSSAGSSAEDGASAEEEDEHILVKLSTKTLADVVESLIGAAYLSGGLDRSIICADVFDIGIPWAPMKSRIHSILQHVEPLSEPPMQLQYPERMIGYTFTRKLLLVEALMHASCQSDLNTISYERMEFLGDSVLDVIIVDMLYNAEGKNYSPAQIHERKAALVNSYFLAYICLKTHAVQVAKMPKWESAKGMSITQEKHAIYLWQCLLHSSHRVLDEQRDTFRRYEVIHKDIEAAFEKNELYPWAALTRLQAPKFLSDIVESLIGAAYLDSEGDLQIVKQILEKLGILRILRRIIWEDVDVRHPHSKVFEWAAKAADRQIEYTFTQERGEVSCTLMLNGEKVHSATERYVGRASQDVVKLRVAEEGIKILGEKHS